MHHFWIPCHCRPSSPIIQMYHAAGVMTILRAFGLKALTQVLESVDGVHEVWNLLSLEPNLHTPFDHIYLVRRHQ